MAVQQTECYRVVTIGYLKDFIGTLIQDSSNGSVKYVNLNALSEEKRRDDYCPTYSELTSNSLVQTWNPGDTPNGDRDGIVVSSSAILGGNYAANQLVDQRDLSLMYTRIKAFSISASSEWISACSGETVVSYTHTYNRNLKYMNSSCTIQDGGNTAVTDTNDSEVTLSTSSFGIFGGWSNHTKTLTIPKNSSSTGQADERYTDVSGDISFRGSGHTYVVRVNQYALTGSVSYVVTTYTATTSVAAYPSTNQTFTDCGEHAWGAYGIRYYDKIERRCWIDNCGDIYPSISSDTVVGSEQVDVGTSAGTFSAVDCPNTSCSDSVNVAFTADGRTSNTLVFQRSGSNSCVYCTCSAAGLGTQVSNTVTSSKVPVATYSSSDCSGTWQVTGLRSGTDFLDQNSIEFSNGYIYAAVGADNTSEDVRQAQYNVAIMNGSTEECSDYFTVYQNGTKPTPPPPTPGPDPKPTPPPDEYPKYPIEPFNKDNYLEVRGTDNGTDVTKDRNTGEYYLHYSPLIAADNDGTPLYRGHDTDSVYISGPIYYCANGDCNNKRLLGEDWVDFGPVRMRRKLKDDTGEWIGWYMDSAGNPIPGIEVYYDFTPPDDGQWYKFEIRLSAQEGGQRIDCTNMETGEDCVFNGAIATEWNWALWVPPRDCGRVDTCYDGECHSGWAHCV
jgi:hypothetical protein